MAHGLVGREADFAHGGEVDGDFAFGEAAGDGIHAASQLHDEEAVVVPIVAGGGMDGEPFGADVDAALVLGEGEQGGLIWVRVGVGQRGERPQGGELGHERDDGEPHPRHGDGGKQEEADAGDQAGLAAAAGVIGVGEGHEESVGYGRNKPRPAVSGSTAQKRSGNVAFEPGPDTRRPPCSGSRLMFGRASKSLKPFHERSWFFSTIG